MNTPTIEIEPGYHVGPAEVWDATKCARMAKRLATDSLGTPYPFKGYIGGAGYGTHSFNGGTVIDDVWYQGVVNPFPVIPDEYEIVYVPAWGYRIRLKGA